MGGAGLGTVVLGTTVGGETGSKAPWVADNLDETDVRGLGTGSGSSILLVALDMVDDSDWSEGTGG